MDFNGREIQVTFTVLARINISRNYWKSSLNKLDSLEQGRHQVYQVLSKTFFFLTCSLPLSPEVSFFSFREGGKKKVI